MVEFLGPEIRIYPPVLTKHDFVRRYQEGEFGNASPTWNGISDWLQSGYDKGLFHLRNRVAGASTWYDVRAENMVSVWESALRQGNAPENLYISAMAPTTKTIYQGEVQQTPDGLSLFGSGIKKPMRESLIDGGITTTGSTASLLLRTVMCPNSWEWLNILLKRYPDHVVEFSAYDVLWGNLPNFNSVFWEVRNY